MTSRETVTYNEHWLPVYTMVLSKYPHLVNNSRLLSHSLEIRCSDKIILSFQKHYRRQILHFFFSKSEINKVLHLLLVYSQHSQLIDPNLYIWHRFYSGYPSGHKPPHIRGSSGLNG